MKYCSLYERRDTQDFECNVCGCVFSAPELAMRGGRVVCLGHTKEIPPSKMTHLMLDLETLGTNPQSVITQIGACYFDMRTGDIGDKFSVNIQIQDCLNHGLVLDGSTVRWWFEQPEHSRTWLKAPVSLSKGLTDFRNFCKGAEHVWSHATFDVPILQNAYLAIGQKKPFHYRAAKDLRTLSWLWCGDYKKQYPNENQHDALSDCIYQVKYATHCFKEIKWQIK